MHDDMMLMGGRRTRGWGGRGDSVLAVDVTSRASGKRLLFLYAMQFKLNEG